MQKLKAIVSYPSILGHTLLLNRLVQIYKQHGKLAQFDGDWALQGFLTLSLKNLKAKKDGVEAEEVAIADVVAAKKTRKAKNKNTKSYSA
jgi:hypothetical protein